MNHSDYLRKEIYLNIRNHGACYIKQATTFAFTMLPTPL